MAYSKVSSVKKKIFRRRIKKFSVREQEIIGSRFFPYIATGQPVCGHHDADNRALLLDADASIMRTGWAEPAIAFPDGRNPLLVELNSA
jgi:hypothetical protein